MKAGFQYIFYCTILMALFTACSKDSTTTDDGSGTGPHVLTPSDVRAPVIEITTPTNNQVFPSGNMINITGKLTDDYGLYRGSISITNDADGLVLKEQLYEIHGLVTYNFTLNYIAVVGAPADYTATVAFEDHGLNKTTKSVKVKVNP